MFFHPASINLPSEQPTAEVDQILIERDWGRVSDAFNRTVAGIGVDGRARKHKGVDFVREPRRNHS